MMDTPLKLLLEPIARSYRRFRLLRGLAYCWIGASLGIALAMILHAVTGWWAPWLLPALGLGLVLSALAVWSSTRKLEPALKWLAREIEQENPRLNSVLLAALEQQPDSATGKFGYLQERVIEEALAQNRKLPWMQRHLERWFFAHCAHAASLALLLILFGATFFLTPARWTALAGGQELEVTPGNTSIERGSSLVVLVKFGTRPPGEATMVAHFQAEESRRIPLSKSLDDPMFGGTLSEVGSDLVYYIEYDGQRTPSYQVTVYDFPALQRADATLTFPQYTQQPVKKIENTRRLSAVEGTELVYEFLFNKPVARAELAAKDETALALAPDPQDPKLYRARLTLEESRQFELRLTDDAGRTNKSPALISIDVVQNKPAELKFAFPRGDQRVSALQEMGFQGEFSDDFGLAGYGLAYTHSGAETQFVELGGSTGPFEKRAAEYLLALEDLSAKPGELLTYYLWADDYGADGVLRRNAGEIYFAEVRHFEEIFRQGSQSPPSEGQMPGGGNSPGEQLAEIQKQIISATWNLQRKETRSKPSENYAKDAGVIQESQERALEMAREMESRVESPDLKPVVEMILTEMDKASQELGKASADNTVQPLPAALNAEQAAYQGLLKLLAREFEVSRNRGGGGGGGGGRNQQQLDQLELKQTENLYETERQATAERRAEQREDLQVLNRLKELAQRQQDLNQRLQELQTALQEAKTEEEQEALRRQLKRLREEEQQILADVDELRQRMNRPENRSQMAESREQLEQTRSEVMRASEELERGEVSQALAAGTRAERDLQQLRDDFRKQSSSRFMEEMRDMRSQARQMVEKQEELAQQIKEINESQQKSLSDTFERGGLAEELSRQKTALTNLLTHMRQVTEESEASEPLLSRQLYDTIRQTDQGKANNALDMTSELVRRGFLTQANDMEPQARQIMENLKEGVEQAAESVLGDELEALRLARSELDALRQRVEDEMNRALQEGGAGQGMNSTNQAGQNLAQAGQAGNPSGNPGESQPSGSQDGPSAASGQEPGQSGAGQSSSESPDAQPGQGGERPGQLAQSGGQPGRGQGSPEQASQAGRPNSPGGDSTSGQQRADAGGGGRAGGGPNNQRAGGNFFDGPWRGNPNGPLGPLTGEGYRDWADRLRDVEDMIDSPELRGQVAEIRDRARGVREEFKRHSLEPQWPLVQAHILSPLVEVRKRINEELARRESKDSLVPIDRDPVPQRYSELVRRYYETLGNNEE